MNKVTLIIILVFSPTLLFSQGINNTWLLGNDPGWINFGRIIFDTNSYQLFTENRKMAFKGTQATISDELGNFLMSSNGVWIANANNDTMMNGAGLNPGWNVSFSPDGLLIPYGNIFLPFPGDNSKFLLIHEVKTNQFSIDPTIIYYSIIDIALDGGLGGVIQKNIFILEDTLSLGLASCRHANGRDWWVIAITDGNPIVYKMLFTPNGLESITTQMLNFTPNTWGNLSQITFSQDGTKLIYNTGVNQTQSGHLLLMDFNRCSGIFLNEQIVPLSVNSYLWGLAFSPSGEFVYACNSGNIFQINTNTLTVDTVAIYDGFVSGFPPNCCATTFWNMYLAANGKIYITSGNGVQHIHEMNYPDSAGVTCDVQQHNIALGNYFHLRAVPNHPNYYLGALSGSPCDTLTSSVELAEHDFQFSASPNPSSGEFRVMYLLPQNQSGKLEIFDVNGRRIYEMDLPVWSTMQFVNLPEGLASGVYSCVIRADHERVNKKIVVIKE